MKYKSKELVKEDTKLYIMRKRLNRKTEWMEWGSDRIETLWTALMRAIFNFYAQFFMSFYWLKTFLMMTHVQTHNASTGHTHTKDKIALSFSIIILDKCCSWHFFHSFSRPFQNWTVIRLSFQDVVGDLLTKANGWHLAQN